MFCLSAEHPFVRSVGNEGKVAFRPSERKEVFRLNRQFFVRNTTLAGNWGLLAKTSPSRRR